MPCSFEALFRFHVISEVLAEQRRGRRREAAVRAVAAREHSSIVGTSRTVSRRSIYRWLERHQEAVARCCALEAGARRTSSSGVLIEHARVRCSLAPDEHVDPTTSGGKRTRGAAAAPPADVAAWHRHHQVEVRAQAGRDVDLDVEHPRAHGQQPDEEAVEGGVRAQKEAAALGAATDRVGRAVDDAAGRSHAARMGKGRAGKRHQ
jgi:hypothetical protein